MTAALHITAATLALRLLIGSVKAQFENSRCRSTVLLIPVPIARRDKTAARRRRVAANVMRNAQSPSEPNGHLMPNPYKLFERERVGCNASLYNFLHAFLFCILSGNNARLQCYLGTRRCHNSEAKEEGEKGNTKNVEQAVESKPAPHQGDQAERASVANGTNQDGTRGLSQIFEHGKER